MARSLDELKTELWSKFDEAVKRHGSYEDSNSSGSSTPFNPRIENRNAIASIANAIVNIEREQREQRREKEEAEKLTLPGKKLSAG